MPVEIRFACPLPNGIHARPASALEAVARRFASEILLRNTRTGCMANSKSVLSLVGADIQLNDPCILTFSGADEQNAMAALSVFLRDTLPHCDDALPALPAAGGLTLPPSLRGSGVVVRTGLAVVPGIGQGRVLRAGGFQVPATLATEGAPDSEAEKVKVDAALQQLVDWYDQRMTSARNKIEVELLAAHRSMARDSEFRQQLLDAITQRRRTAAGAIADAEAHFSAMLNASRSALLRERVLDVQDICIHLLHLIYGSAAGMPNARLTTDVVVVAESLTPGQFLALDRRFLKGLVLAQAGTTSHTVILARSFDLPTLVSVNGLLGARLDGEEAVVDGDLGALVTNLTDAARRYYARERRRLEDRRARLRKFAIQPATTSDGHRLEIAANVASADEAAPAFIEGAEGIGLFRTEMLFLDRESAPDESEQFEAYRRVLEAAGSRPVIIRTLDIGGDKPLGYLDLSAEENPFLGYRAVRIYPEFESLFRTQLRALVRASAHGPLKVMLPMVATVEEVRWAKRILAEERARCGAESIAFDAAMPLGAMIEVPAAALGLDALARELDFFSIGSNDLLQYFMAVDRTNARVASLYNPLQPAFLRLLQQIVNAAHAQHKWVGLCGEMGGQARYLPLLTGLGLDEISVAAPAIAGLKAGLAQLALPDCRNLLAAALDCVTADEVAALLEKFAAQRSAPLLDPELVIVDAEAASKEEAIKQGVDRLYVLGRTDRPRVVEEAVWQREAAYSTGFGHGFAIPHCKTNAVQSNSLAVVKLREPVAWGSLDGLPVRCVILLAMRETDCANEHLKVLARLARKVMHEGFRTRLEHEPDAQALCAFLREQLQL